MKKKITIRTSVAFILWAALLTGAFVFTADHPDAQFNTYASWLTIGLAAYTSKRLLQKSPKFKDKG